jgi:hypothetical protein
MAALAAAGLSSASASQATSQPSSDSNVQSLSAGSSVAAPAITVGSDGADHASHASAVLTGGFPLDDAPVNVSAPAIHDEVVGKQPLTTNDVKAAGPDELLHATNVASHGQSDAAAPVAAMAVAMPSAEQLLAAGSATNAQAAGVNGAPQHNEIVSNVLVDALNGGEGHGPNIEALVSQISGHGGSNPALEALASQAAAAASFGHMGFAGTFGGVHVLGMEMMHQDAAPAAHG